MQTPPGILTAKNLPAVTAALGRPIVHAGDLVDAAAMGERSPLWIHESTFPKLGLPDRLPASSSGARGREIARYGVPHPFTQRAIDAGFEIYPAGLAHWLVGRRDGTPRVDLAPAGYGDAAGVSGPELLAGVRRYEALLGVPFRWSAGSTSTALLRLAHRRGTPLEASGEPVPPAADRTTETAFHWFRDPTLEERTRRYVHALDLNAMYLAAASTIELGFGEPEHLIPKRGDISFDARSPGYWRVGLRSPDPNLPDPFRPAGRRLQPDLCWFATPTVALASELGMIRGISEAFVYPRRHRFLEGWYEKLRDARGALVGSDATGDVLALRLVKLTYTKGLGFLAGYFHDDGAPLRRPDWWHHVAARARANLYRRILKLPTGARPFAVDVDCLYIASDLPDARLAAPGLSIGSRLGEFKPVGIAKMVDALDAIDDRNPLRALSQLVKR